MLWSDNPVWDAERWATEDRGGKEWREILQALPNEIEDEEEEEDDEEYDID